MLISHNWLAKFLPELNKYSTEQIAEALSGSIAEVEQVIPVRQELEKIVVAEVISVNKHPNSDKLSLCKVTTDGQNSLPIVCGAPNVVANAKVALCLPGGKVYADAKRTVATIQPTTIRGETSEGMICSPMELGIGSNHEGILILEDSIEIGEDITAILKDYVYEIENKALSHRGDCFSHKGMARELSAILTLDFMESEQSLETLLPTGEKKHLAIEIEVGKELCPRFSALLIESLEIKQSPLWMQSRLTAVGERTINNVVDITNYTMLDIGQPLHAYDYDKLAGKKLIVRKAKTNETVTTLDELDRKLDKDMVVISDNDSVEDIAGIMGGMKSSVTETTKTIILEAANWEMFNIRRTSRKLGLRTEASTRFEKGLDPNITQSALENAFIFISDLAHGELATEKFDYYPEPYLAKEIELDVNLVNRTLSLNLSKYEIIEILERLHIEANSQEISDGSNPNQEGNTNIVVKIPTFRRDLNIKEDLIEEVARIYGFQNLQPKLPERDLTPPKAYAVSHLFRKINTRLVSLGSDEVKTYSFIGEKEYTNSNLDIKSALKLKNPLAPELSYFRTSLIPSLLNVGVKNQQMFGDYSVFEIGRVVLKDKDEDGIHKQPWNLALVMAATDAKQALTGVKGILENLGALLNLDLKFVPTAEKEWRNPSLLHPFQSGTILLNKEPIGAFGVLNPEVAFNFELKSKLGIFELELDPLINYADKAVIYKPLISFPEIKRDLSFWLNGQTKFAAIEQILTNKDYPLLKSLMVKDVYKQKDRQSITLSLSFQSSEKTLTDSEVDAVIAAMTKELTSKLKLELRSE